MSNREKPHFSRNALNLGERVQHSLGHSILGGRIIRAFNGSNSPNYRQLNWFSKDIETDIKRTVTVPGDAGAGWFARSWRTAMVMAADGRAFEELFQKDSFDPSRETYQEAVAYISDGVVRVGIEPNPFHQTRDDLFGVTPMADSNERAIAMRRGKGLLEATMGIWLPFDRTFVSVNDLRVVQQSVEVDEFGPQSQELSEVFLV